MLITAGSDLQAALNAAEPGDTIDLDAGATFTGNFTIGATAQGPPITVTGAATLRTRNSLPALRTLGRAANWRFTGVSFVAGASQGDIVQLGDGVHVDLSQVPTGFLFERCAILAETTAKRGLQLNAAAVTLRDCSITGVKLAGQESQAICGWNGPGPFLIEDCHIEAGSIGILFGGAAPTIPNLVPSDITVRRTRLTRPLAMHGGGWAVKNLFELKNARRVVVTGNVLEHNWPDGQAGWAVVFTVRANGAAPWSTIEDVRFDSNVVRHVAMGFNVLGLDDNDPSQRMRDVRITNNLLHGLDRETWGGNGSCLNIGGGPERLHVEQNTILHTGNVISVNGPPCQGFRYVGNLSRHNDYGIFGDWMGTGNATIAHYLPGSVIENNVLAGGAAHVYSSRPNNQFPATADLLAAFVDPAAGNYRQRAGSAWAGCGCDQDAVEAAQRKPVVMPPPPPPPPPPVPVPIADTIKQHYEAASVACDAIDGDVSPQAAARQALMGFRDALLAALDA